MSDDNFLTRREFTIESALAILTAVTVTITGCGDDDDSPTTTPSPSGNRVGTISDNHGHVAVVTGAQIAAANIILVDIQGAATHPHSIELLTGQLRQIGMNERVTVGSTSTEGHRHMVTFN
jgi:hypothetical protein